MPRLLTGSPTSFRTTPSSAVSAAVSTVAAGLGTIVAVSLIATTLVAQSPAFGAVTGGDSSNGTVSVGASDGGSTPGAPGVASEGGPGPSGTSPWTCNATSLVLNDEGGFAPGGPTPGGWYSVTCNNSVTGASTTQTEWFASQAAPAAPAVDARTVALQAENSLRLPSPTLHFNPGVSSVVNLPTWLWIDQSLWHAYSVTATVGTVSATAVATPVAVVWQMGDGGVVTCTGPGRAFDVSQPVRMQKTACAYSYRTSSLGQPSADGNPDAAAFLVRATVTWTVTWSATGAEGQGTLPTLETSAVAPLRVVEVESVDTGPAGPSRPSARAADRENRP